MSSRGNYDGSLFVMTKSYKELCVKYFAMSSEELKTEAGREPVTTINALGNCIKQVQKTYSQQQKYIGYENTEKENN